MSTDANKELIRRYIQAIDDNDSSDWGVIDEYVDEDVIVHNPPLPGCTPDRDGIKQAAEMFRQATPGRHEVRMQVAEGDLVVSHVFGRARMRANFSASRRPATRSRPRVLRCTG
jgi:hypothetical protein